MNSKKKYPNAGLASHGSELSVPVSESVRDSVSAVILSPYSAFSREIPEWHSRYGERFALALSSELADHALRSGFRRDAAEIIASLSVSFLKVGSRSDRVPERHPPHGLLAGFAARCGLLSEAVAMLGGHRDLVVRSAAVSSILDSSDPDAATLEKIGLFVSVPDFPDSRLVTWLKWRSRARAAGIETSPAVDDVALFVRMAANFGPKSVFRRDFQVVSRVILESAALLNLPVEPRISEILEGLDRLKITDDWVRWTVAENLLDLSKTVHALGFDPLPAFMIAVAVSKIATDSVDIDYHDCLDSIREFDMMPANTAFAIGRPDLAEECVPEFVRDDDELRIRIRVASGFSNRVPEPEPFLRFVKALETGDVPSAVAEFFASTEKVGWHERRKAARAVADFVWKRKGFPVG